MSVYVDDMRLLARVGRLYGHWSHLTADSVEELLAFGERLGMKSTWLQEGDNYQFHFDVMDSKRERAIALGAIPVSPYELVERMMARRAPAE